MRSMYFMAVALAGVTWFQESFAKMDWIYKELRREQDGASSATLYQEILNVP